MCGLGPCTRRHLWRHFRFSALIVAAGCRYCTCGKGRPALSPSIIISFTDSLGHAFMHEDTVSSTLLRPDSCPSLQGDVQSWDHVLVSPLTCFTLLPLSAFLHTWRDLPGVSTCILRTIQFGYTLQFARNPQTPMRFCPTTGSFLSFAQRGNRVGPLFGSKPRLLQPVLSRPEGGWGLRPILDLRRRNYSLYRGQKSMLTPAQQITFLVVCLDSTLMLARLATAGVESIQSWSALFRLRRRVWVGLCCRLLGLMAAASPVLPLELLHMRPFLWWKKSLGIRLSWPSLRLLR